MISRLLGAVQYLTVVPVRRRTAAPGQSAIFFPLAGAALGACGGLVLEMSLGYVPLTLVCLLVLTFWTAITGAKYESGFAAVAGSSGAGTLNGGSIGAGSAIAVLLLMLVRWQALSSIAVQPVAGLGAALALGRTAMVALAWIAPPAGERSTASLAPTLQTSVAIAAISQALVFAMWPGARTASILLGGTTTIVLLARRLFVRRFGGVNESCLGATEQVVETFCLIVYTCRPCIS